MKVKVAVWLLALLLLPACFTSAVAENAPRGYTRKDGYQYFEIGTYPQGAKGETEPLLWRALAVENQRALLLTEYVIDARQVIFETDEKIIAKHAYRRIASFAESDLCRWMNTDMLERIMGDTGLENALVEGEFGRLYPLTDDQLLMPEYGFSSARFGDVPLRRASPTAYAQSEGVYKHPIGAAPYWVATLKTKEGYKLQIVGYNGHLSYGAFTRTNIGVRPAMTVDLSLCSIAGGDGSRESPFRLALRSETQSAAPVSSLSDNVETVQAQPAATAEAETTASSQAASKATAQEKPTAAEKPAATVQGRPTATAQPEPTPTPAAVTALTKPEMDTDDAGTETTLSLLGDCSIGDAYQSRNQAGSLTGVIARNGAAWPFSLVAANLKADGITAANLEVCLTDSAKASDKMYPLVAPPENAAVLTEGGVDVVNTVNNHCFDFGTAGYDDTLAALDAAGVAHFGTAERGGKPYSSLTVIRETDGIRFGFAGFSYPQNQTLEEISAQIQALREAGCDVVVVSLHWGRETYANPNAGQPAYAAKIIDLGADVVWGHHPHVLQPIQFYKGKPIFFSTGNFIFGTMGPADPATGIFQLRYRKTVSGVSLTQLAVVPCVTQGSGDYRPYEVTDEAARKAVWKALRADKTYKGYENLPESFLTTGCVELDGNSSTAR